MVCPLFILGSGLAADASSLGTSPTSQAGKEGIHQHDISIEPITFGLGDIALTHSGRFEKAWDWTRHLSWLLQGNINIGYSASGKNLEQFNLGYGLRGWFFNERPLEGFFMGAAFSLGNFSSNYGDWWYQ